MNKDQINGAIKGAAGRAQAHAGKTIGSDKQEAKGLLKQGQGRLQKAYGDLKAALRNSKHT